MLQAKFFKQCVNFFALFLSSLLVISLFCAEYKVTELPYSAIRILVYPVLPPYNYRMNYNLVQKVGTRRQHQHFTPLHFWAFTETRQPVNGKRDCLVLT